MSLASRAAALWRNLTRSELVERDLDAELHATFDLLVDEKTRAGMGPADARRAAAIELGGLEAVKEQVRDVRAGASLDSVLQDVRYAARTLRRTPMFAATAALSLGIGIAGSAVVFSVADALLLRYPSGIANPAGLAEVGRTDSGEGATSTPARDSTLFLTRTTSTTARGRRFSRDSPRITSADSRDSGSAWAPTPYRCPGPTCRRISSMCWACRWREAAVSCRKTNAWTVRAPSPSSVTVSGKHSSTALAT
jgi:hypothetical protein